MARAGETINNTVTGERFTWRRVAADTDGRLVMGEMVLPPGGFVAAEHVHPNQEERYEILAGELRVRLDGREQTVGPGDRVVVPAGRPHIWWNAGREDVRFRCEVTPALHFETFIETFFGRLRELAAQYDLPELSMGTSQDYRVAAEEGATLVRVGSVLYEQ